MMRLIVEMPCYLLANKQTPWKRHMTTQASDQLCNHFPVLDFSGLNLSKVFIGQPAIFNDKEYPFKAKPKKSDKILFSTACWRGYIAYYDLHADGSLTLTKYVNLSNETQIVNETLLGDFWLEMNSLECDGTIYIPFAQGKINIDRNSWQGNGELFAMYKNVEALKIREFVTQRNVEYLVHFTRIENLENILATGLIGREDLREKRLQYISNDMYRLDYIPNSICLSLSFPNYKMFYSYRCQDPTADWVVLRLKPEILWKHKTLFCTRNAAEKEIAQQSREQRSGLKALEKMFENHEGFPCRELTQIPDHYSTNPQAEVLVLEHIDSKFIVDVIVDREEKINNQARFAKIINENSSKVKFYRGKDYFYPRTDHKHW
jgi:hypothetical protein